MIAALSQRHRKWLGWLRLLAGFVSVQVVIQLFGFLSGILLVQCLIKEQYAYFTIGNSMLAMMNMLADNGISSALSSIGGRICEDAHRFGSLVNTALRLRRFFASAAVLLVSPVLVFMLVNYRAKPEPELTEKVSLPIVSSLPVGAVRRTIQYEGSSACSHVA